MKHTWKTLLPLGGTLFVLYLAIHYWPAICDLAVLVFGAAFPLLLGCVIAYALNILMSMYERYFFPNSTAPFVQKGRRPLCLVLAFATLAGLVFWLIRMILPELVNCVALLIQKAVPILEGLTKSLDKNLDLSNLLNTYGVSGADGSIDWRSVILSAVDWLVSGLGGVMGSMFTLVSTISSAAFTAIVSLIFSIYLLIGKERLGRQCDLLLKTYLTPGWYDGIKYFLYTLNGCFHRFLVGQCTEAVILGLLCMGGMMLFGFPYATMVGALIGFTALIPVAGAYIGAGVGAFMIFTVSPVQALLFLLFIVVLQQLEGNLIYPKVVGSSIGLPGIWVLTAVTIGGGIMGIFGMLLAVPVAAACYQMLRDDVRRRTSTVVESSPAPESLETPTHQE